MATLLDSGFNHVPGDRVLDSLKVIFVVYFFLMNKQVKALFSLHLFLHSKGNNQQSGKQPKRCEDIFMGEDIYIY
jgi:hypothetical protein